MRIHPYLAFPGTCEEAFTFYAELFSGVVTGVNRYGEGSPFPVQDAWGEKVIHAELAAGGAPGIHLYAFNEHKNVTDVLRRAGLV